MAPRTDEAQAAHLTERREMAAQAAERLELEILALRTAEAQASRSAERRRRASCRDIMEPAFVWTYPPILCTHMRMSETIIFRTLLTDL